jgi:DNA-binding MarR family transcriptional regulator
MRDFKRFLQLIKLHAFVHADIRPTVEYDGNKFLLASLEDLKVGTLLFETAFITSATGLPENIIDFYRRVLCPLSEDRVGVSISELTAKFVQVYKRGISEHTIREHYVKPLLKAGLVDVKQDPDDKRKKLVYPLIIEESMIKEIVDKVPEMFTYEEFKKVMTGVVDEESKLQKLYKEVVANAKKVE